MTTKEGRPTSLFVLMVSISGAVILLLVGTLAYFHTQYSAQLEQLRERVAKIAGDTEGIKNLSERDLPALSLQLETHQEALQMLASKADQNTQELLKKWEEALEALGSKPETLRGEESQRPEALSKREVADLREAARIRHAQGLLRQVGFAPGPLDGLWGKKTARAVRQFQRWYPEQPLASTGILDAATYAALIQASASGEAPLGQYRTVTRTPVLGEPRVEAKVVARLHPQTRVQVVGVSAEYLAVRSRHGKPPGYVLRKDVVFLQENLSP